MNTTDFHSESHLINSWANLSVKPDWDANDDGGVDTSAAQGVYLEETHRRPTTRLCVETYSRLSGVSATTTTSSTDNNNITATQMEFLTHV